MTDIPTFPSMDFQWRNGEGYASLANLRLTEYPRKGFRIRSARSREVRQFEYDHSHNEENDFFDGERMSFISYRGNVRVILSVD